MVTKLYYCYTHEEMAADEPCCEEAVEAGWSEAVEAEDC